MRLLISVGSLDVPPRCGQERERCCAAADWTKVDMSPPEGRHCLTAQAPLSSCRLRFPSRCTSLILEVKHFRAGSLLPRTMHPILPSRICETVSLPFSPLIFFAFPFALILCFSLTGAVWLLTRAPLQLRFLHSARTHSNSTTWKPVAISLFVPNYLPKSIIHDITYT